MWAADTSFFPAGSRSSSSRSIRGRSSSGADRSTASDTDTAVGADVKSGEISPVRVHSEGLSGFDDSSGNVPGGGAGLGAAGARRPKISGALGSPADGQSDTAVSR